MSDDCYFNFKLYLSSHSDRYLVRRWPMQGQITLTANQLLYTVIEKVCNNRTLVLILTYRAIIYFSVRTG